MKENRKGKSLIPKLRFPEFRGMGGWKVEALGEQISLEYGSSLPESKRKRGKFPVVGSNGIVGYHSEFLVEGPAIIVGRKGSVGEISWVESNCFPIDTTFYVRNKNVKTSSLAFIKLLLENLNLPEQRDSSAVPGLNRDRVYSIGIARPSLPEQQRIADCLTSLDELITSESKKLDALKTHKKGLMQKLFPAEGESIPELRFPEFRGTGEWEVKELGDKTDKVGSGITPKGGDKNYKTSRRPFIRSQNVGWGNLILDDVAYIDEETHATFLSTEIANDDVLLNITGASIGRSAVAKHNIQGGNVNQHVCIIRTKPRELRPFFLNQFILSNRGQSQIDSFQAGGNRQGLNFAQIRSFLIPMPPETEEQEKLADCLTSLDEIIVAQAQKIDALKIHKKGLMQGLFPSADEVGV